MRRARVLIHLAVLVLLPIAARANDDPVFDSPAMRVCFVDLLRKVGWGLAGPFERAAFVIEGDDGSLSCDPWPSTHGYLTESFHGIVPAHAIAIVHTHPVRFPMPIACRSEEHTSELQSRFDLVCRLLLEKKNNQQVRTSFL